MKEHWRKVSNDNIAKNLLDSIAELLDGKWHRSETLDHTGKRTRRYIIESDITDEPDSSESDVSGVIAATLSVIVAGYFHGHMHLITTLKNATSS